MLPNTSSFYTKKYVRKFLKEDWGAKRSEFRINTCNTYVLLINQRVKKFLR